MVDDLRDLSNKKYISANKKKKKKIRKYEKFILSGNFVFFIIY